MVSTSIFIPFDFPFRLRIIGLDSGLALGLVLSDSVQSVLTVVSMRTAPPSGLLRVFHMDLPFGCQHSFQK